uniref:Midgut carboxypeptidase n=1 Tax=Loxostege sticticalis TaxID=481309 RepID=B5TGP9_LOXSC|nr:midgut carboxypeptidase [Loxostege sticticalis]
MANFYKSIFVFCATFYLVCARHEAYDGHALYEVVVKNEEQALFVNGLMDAIPVDVFSYANIERAGEILVPKEQKNGFEAMLTAKDIKYSILTENIKEQLDWEDMILAEAKSKPLNTTSRSSRLAPLPLDRTYTFQEVDNYLVRVANAFPNRATVASAGRSLEGRDTKYLKISTTNFQDRRKPIIYVQSLLHAREWVTLPATLYAIEKLVIDVTDHDLLRDFDWIIMPIANPDGFEWSHTRNGRFWRKNRRTNRGSTCRGVDLNRNFDVAWGTASSRNPCAEDFHGTGAFSEPESVNIRRVLSAYADRIDMFIDIHSFGSMILFGRGTGELAPNALTLNYVGVQMAQAIDRVKWPTKPNYTVGNIVHVLGMRASGGLSDYAQIGQGIPISYAYELPAYRGRRDINGFLVEPAFIRQAGVETWEGIKAGARTIRNL